MKEEVSRYVFMQKKEITIFLTHEHIFACTAKDLSQFQWKSAHAPKKELPKDFL